MRVRPGESAVIRLPEFNVALFALLLNFPWEILQAPLFDRMTGQPHWDAVMSCAQATLGDVVIMLMAYWLVAACARSRRWILAPTGSQRLLFVTVGVVVTAVIEWLAVRGSWFEGWRYSPLMPVIPGIGIGLSPLLQWIVLPLLSVWFVRRQLAGAEALAEGT